MDPRGASPHKYKLITGSLEQEGKWGEEERKTCIEYMKEWIGVTIFEREQEKDGNSYSERKRETQHNRRGNMRDMDN